jgi:medium-chain acyl-[acyl-carrier-protein] hydrolase
MISRDSLNNNLKIGINNKKSLAFPKANPNARLRLFCFPYAGGGAHIYFPWQEKLPSWIEVCAIQLPGRGVRFSEQAYCQYQPVVAEVVESIGHYLDKPYALFGHSMGALLAYEVAQAIQQKGWKQAEHLFVSGRRATHIHLASNPIYNLPKDQLIAELRQLNGTPTQVLENNELMDMVLPVLRADFELCDTYQHNSYYQKLTMDITAFEGDQDHKAQGHQVSAWQELTKGDFDSQQLLGDHFFLHHSEADLLQLLEQKLSNKK